MVRESAELGGDVRQMIVESYKSSKNLNWQDVWGYVKKNNGIRDKIILQFGSVEN